MIRARLMWLAGVLVAAGGTLYAMEMGPAKAGTEVKVAVIYTDASGIVNLPAPEDWNRDVAAKAITINSDSTVNKKAGSGADAGKCNGTDLENFYFYRGVTVGGGGNYADAIRFYSSSSVASGNQATGTEFGAAGDLGNCHVDWDPDLGTIDTLCNPATGTCNARLVVAKTTAY